MATYYDHPSSDAIELYSLGRLPEPELQAFEEHLLICSSCQASVTKEDEFHRGIVHALEHPRES